jgi:hypothetical protein
MNDYVATNLVLSGLVMRSQAMKIYEMISEMTTSRIENIRLAYEHPGDDFYRLIGVLEADSGVLPQPLEAYLKQCRVAYTFDWEDGDFVESGVDFHNPLAPGVYPDYVGRTPFMVADSHHHLDGILKRHPEMTSFLEQEPVAA